MKHPPPREAGSRFSGGLRHYHRVGPKTQRTWDEWIDATQQTRAFSKWVRILAVIVALLALAGIIAGLIIELQ